MTDCGEIIAVIRQCESWPPKMIGARVEELTANESDAVEVLDLIRLVLRDGQERAINTSIRTPRGILYRRLSIHRRTKTSVSIIASRLKWPVFRRG